MQSGAAQQVVALLQAAGALTPEAAAYALVQEKHTDGNLLQTLITSGALSFDDLQEVLLLYGQLADGDTLTTPAPLIALDGTAAGVERAVDEYRIDDLQLQTLSPQERASDARATRHGSPGAAAHRASSVADRD